MAQAPQQPQQPVQQGAGGGPSGPRAGFWRRFGAVILDGIILGIVASIITALVGGADDGRFSATYQGIQLLLGVVYFSYFEGSSGQTVGKRAAGIRVIDFGGGGPIGTGRALGRYFARWLSAIPLALGYLWMLWDQEKQTWHDKLTNCVVVPTDAYPVEKWP